MPRIRSIKPEFWSHDQVIECSTNARLLFVGLWNFCDDKGRHKYSLKSIKAEVFPADNFTSDDIRGMLDELSSNGLIVEYTIDNVEYFYIDGWHHQKIDKPQPARYPGPIDEHSENDPGTLDPDTIRYDTIGNETKGKDTLGEKIEIPLQEAVDLFNQLAGECGLARCQKLTKARESKLKNRLIDCGGIDGWNAALDKIRGSPGLQGKANGKDHADWRVDFDFLISEGNFTKIMEGKYDQWTDGKREQQQSVDALILKSAGLAGDHRLD